MVDSFTTQTSPRPMHCLFWWSWEPQIIMKNGFHFQALHIQNEQLEEARIKADAKVSNHKEATQLLQTELQDNRALVEEKENAIQALKSKIRESEVCWFHITAQLHFSLVIWRMSSWYDDLCPSWFRKNHHPVWLSWRSFRPSCCSWRWSSAQHPTNTNESKELLNSFLHFCLLVFLHCGFQRPVVSRPVACCRTVDSNDRHSVFQDPGDEHIVGGKRRVTEEA